MTKGNLKVAICQLTSTSNLQANVDRILEILESLKTQAQSVDVACFPENAVFFRMMEGDSFPKLTLEHEVFAKIADAIKGHFAVHLGSVSLFDPVTDRWFNSSVLFDSQGSYQATYRKIHLFDICLNSGVSVRESDVFSEGVHPSFFELKGWRIGESICYDLRFAELYSQYASLGAEVILVPSSFLPETGQAHWHILLRARAIESQCYVIAAAQGGVHRSNGRERKTYGHGLVVDPWGRVVAETSVEDPVRVVDLNLAAIQKTREQIPMHRHRRDFASVHQVLLNGLGFVLFLGALMGPSVVFAEELQAPITHVQSPSSDEIREKARKRLYPGGSDEEDLKVQDKLRPAKPEYNQKQELVEALEEDEETDPSPTPQQ